jgi:hypothetical protein
MGVIMLIVDDPALFINIDENELSEKSTKNVE